MTALRFQTGRRYQTFPASIRPKSDTLWTEPNIFCRSTSFPSHWHIFFNKCRQSKAKISGTIFMSKTSPGFDDFPIFPRPFFHSCIHHRRVVFANYTQYRYSPVAVQFFQLILLWNGIITGLVHSSGYMSTLKILLKQQVSLLIAFLLLLSIPFFKYFFKNLVLINRRNGPRYQRVLALCAFSTGVIPKGLILRKFCVRCLCMFCFM